MAYDARGNLTTSGSTTYTYNRLNQLTGGGYGDTCNNPQIRWIAFPLVAP